MGPFGPKLTSHNWAPVMALRRGQACHLFEPRVATSQRWLDCADRVGQSRVTNR